MDEHQIGKEFQQIKNRLDKLERSKVGDLKIQETDNDDDNYDDKHDDDYELVRRLPEAETITLATFNLSNGNEVRFLGVPALGEIMMGETTNIGVEDFLLNNSEIAPVEIFRRLAPKNSSAPRMLAQIDNTNMLEGRNLVDTLDRPIDVSLDRLGIQPPTLAAGIINSCQVGSAGTQWFENNHCGSLGGPGYGSSESYCFPNASEWIQKTSDSRMRATYTRMACCGSGRCRLRHYYGTVSGYNTQLSVYTDPQKVVHYWSYKRGRRRYRRVRFEALDPGSYVRGWVQFHRQVAEGW